LRPAGAALLACGQPPKTGIEQAFAAHKDELYAIPGVNSITIYSGQDNDRIEISVLPGEKTPQIEAAVPDSIEGYPVTIVEREPPSPPTIDIEGTIRSIAPATAAGQSSGALGTIYVIAGKSTGSTYDKASVKVTGDTSIWVPQGEGKEFLTFADLREGDFVIADFTGAVAESYPVQATAQDIEVLPKP